MSWREPKPRYQIGKWFLAQRGSVWYRCGYNSRTRQTERVSLSTRDFQEAQQRLAEFFIETYNPNKVSKASITLARALTIYYTEHGVNIPSHTSVKTHCEKLIDYWKDALLSDLSIREQRVFKAHLETLGCSEGYIQRIFTTLRAATNFCYKNEYIDQPVNIMSISVPMHNNVEMGRPLSLEEMARLFDAIELDYLMRYCLLMLGTLARPTAIMELHSLQLDHDYRLITLNPPGRKQTKKYRPTVKMPEFIHQATRHLADCNIISGSNVPIKSVKTSFAT
ncbi:hypothetical protein, partial [Zooshikella ganghwensis]|uniref:hypothetical protein n=1 Tax=Zooshikella ganghwensis TaxID=202772 RepID=UPI000684313F